VANPQAADRPAGGCNRLAAQSEYHYENTKYALRVANPRAADRLAGGWPSKRHIIMTP
jgi:hypothetical protein